MKCSYRTAATASAEELALLRLCRHDNVLIGDRGRPRQRWLALRPLSQASAVCLDLRPAISWANAQGDQVESLILFGSQARGAVHEDSDIDFYVVGDAPTVRARTLADAYPGIAVDVLNKSRADFQAVLAGREKKLETVVLDTGVLVTGNGFEMRVNMDAKKRVNVAGMTMHYQAACHRFRVALEAMEIATSQFERLSRPTVPLQEVVAASADCGERVAKAILELAGLTPLKTHTVNELADQLRAEEHKRLGFATVKGLPANDVLASRVMAMDGETGELNLHTIAYSEARVFRDDPVGKLVVPHAHARLASAGSNLLWLRDRVAVDPGFAPVLDEAREGLLVAFDLVDCDVADRAAMETALAAVEERVRRYERAFDLAPWPAELFERVTVALMHPTPTGRG